MKRLYFLMVLFFAAIAVNATTIKGDVWYYDLNTKQSTQADAQIEAEVTIEGNVVTFTNFLGSGRTIAVSATDDGTADHTLGAGDFAGTYTFGSFGDYNSIYLYGSQDFKYGVYDGVKELSFGAYAGSDYGAWFDVYFYLPDDFTPAEAVEEADPSEGKTIITVPVTLGSGSSALTYEYNAYIDGNTLTFTNLFGGSDYISYTLNYTDGTFKLTSNKTTTYCSANFTFNDVANTYAYFYGGTYLKYTESTNKARDYVYFYESAKGSYIYFNFPESIVNRLKAATIKADAYKWDSSSKSAVKGDEQLEAKAFCKDGVVTLYNFLGSDKDFTVTVYNTGKCSDGETAGTIAGTYNLGSFGTYSSLYIYAGTSSYDDFSYSVTDSVKTLHFGGYCDNDWFDIYFYLPDDFEPIDPYAAYDTFQLPVTLGGTSITQRTEEYRAYIEGNTLNIIGLFGMSDLASYTLVNADSLTSSFKKNWYGVSNYTDNDKSLAWIYVYAQQYLSYASATGLVTDYVWFNESNRGDYFSFTLPESIIENVAGKAIKGDVYKWDASTKSSTKADEQITARVFIENGVVTFPNFLGSGQEFAVTVYSTGKCDDGKTTGNYFGTYDFGSFGTRDTLYLYAGSYSYDDFSYSVVNGVKTLSFGCYGDSDWFDVYFYLPDDFEAIDPYAAYDTFQLPVTLGGTSITQRTEEYRAYIEDNTLNIISLFGMSKLATYTLADGAVTSNLSGWLATSNYTDNDTSITYVYSYGKTYLSYDAATGLVTDYIWIYDSNRGDYFTFTLPESMRNATAITTVEADEDNNAPVEYFNIQGVRVSNPENGIFIRRQGNKVTKVVVK